MEATLGDVTAWSVPGTYHDPSFGSKRGKNALFVIETGGLRIVHLGDLGDTPSAEVFERVGRVDVLLIPVGGFFTIDGPTAREVAARFGARVVIPMHYRTAAIAEWQISDEKPFLEGQAVAVRFLHSYHVTVSPQTLPEKPEIWVLEPAPEGRE
ncbi:MAG: MBL fold metallo-hydrolase [Firmicutes bacterium]|nr:MBL fold metallo-hydrolase [Bacillota bacterium]